MIRIPRKLGVLTLALTLLVGLSTPAAAQHLYDPNANPRADIDSALAKARADGKLVLLDFGADWCVDCLVLDTFFRDSTVKPFLDSHFHVVRIDVGRWDHNLDLSKQYGNPIDNGVPAVVILSPKGDVLDSTADGALESARNMTPVDIRKYLERWAARKH